MSRDVAILWKTHSGQLLHASGSVLLIVTSNFNGFVASYTLNKLDNGIYAVIRNPWMGYVTTSLRLVVTTTALGFLNHIHVDPLDSVSNYYIICSC